jgi:cytochrome c biogenesis protein CcdA
MLLVVIPLAIASMVSPVAVITVMAVLSGGEHRARNGVLFVATYGIVFSLICLVFLAVGHLTTSGGKPSLTTVSIDIILGLLLLYASARELLKKKESNAANIKTIGAATVVLGGMVFGFGNIFSSLPALAASKDIGVAVVPPLDKAIAFIVTMVIALCWLWGPLAIFLITPKHFDQYLDPVIRFLRKHGGQLMAAVFFLVGIYLLSRGVIGLSAL